MRLSLWRGDFLINPLCIPASIIDCIEDLDPVLGDIDSHANAEKMLFVHDQMLLMQLLSSHSNEEEIEK